MSSLRLALKQSLQESGGGDFSSGLGEKKKRKKKKITGNNGGSGGNANGTGAVTKKGRREGESGVKRGRGRPRKHPQSQTDYEEDDVTLGDDQPRKSERRYDRPRTSKHNANVEDEDDEFGSENEFSYTEDDSGEDDDDIEDEEVSEDEEDDSPYRNRSRKRNSMDYHEDDEDETMHSDEDDLDPQTSKGPFKGKSPENISKTVSDPAKNDLKGKSDGDSQRVKQLDRSDARTATNFPNDPSTELKITNGNSSGNGVLPNGTNADEQMAKTKLKLLKLKKKLQKSQNSAASRIQSQWKKQKVKNSTESTDAEEPAHLISAAENSTASNTNIVAKLKTPDNIPGSRSTSPKSEAGIISPSEQSTSGVESQQSLSRKKDKFASEYGEDVKSNVSTSNRAMSSDPSAATTTSSGATAGDGGDTAKTDDGEEQPPPAKKKKKKKSNGKVTPPAKEVKRWAANMSVKKSRKYIQMGMRVKVRFATEVKRDGKLVKKKIFYGGKVVAVSKARTKIRIKYDDGTAEVSKFPDDDVMVDAVDNGEHSVPADKFIPPSREELVENEDDVMVKPEEQEEGEIPSPPNTSAIETGEVEVEEIKPKANASREVEVIKPKAYASLPEPSDSGGVQTAHKQSTDDQTTIEEEEIPEKPTDVPSTPPAVTSPTAKSKNEISDDGCTSSNIHGKDVEMEPAPSQEEGELSPGITTAKSSENSPGEKRLDISQQEESDSLPVKSLLSSNFGSESTTTEPIKFADEKPKTTVTKSDNSTVQREKSDEKSVSVFPPKPKKLTIRIPSNSLLSIKSLSTPKSTEGAKSPLANISSNVTPSADVDDILTDTPEAKKELITKRKRSSDDTAPSLNNSSGQEPPTKVKRIKLSLTELNASKTQSSGSISTAKIVQEPDTEEGLGKEELTPITEEPISGETKKKKKKVDRAKSPRPKSPVPNHQLDKIASKNKSNSSEAPSGTVTPKQKIGSKGSAFSAKKPAVKDDSIAASTSAELVSTSASLRTGRKAAEEAKEKLSVKQKAKVNAKETKEKEIAPTESGKKKKKRRREKEAEDHGDESDEGLESELEWVQCDSCKKWRVLPDNVKASSLPDLWYCHLNIYDPKRSNCEAPEQNMKQLLRERKKRARKRAKREAELAEIQQEKATKKSKQKEEETTTTASTKKKNKQDKSNGAGGSTPRSVSPKPTKTIKIVGGKSKEPATETKKSNAEAKKVNVEANKKSKGAVEDQPNSNDSGSDTQKEGKKKTKKGKKESQEAPETQEADDAKKAGRKRGRPARNQTTCTPVPPESSKGNDDEDNVEWVQCDKCEKWRKLPPDISADELPDIWNCSMNTWNPSSASCDAAEDKTDAHHKEVNPSEWQLRQTHAGKYSYRQMIFGTGARKHNRPMSERSRAAESLFIQPSTDEDNPHPTTQYAKSSQFLPRLSNFQKNNTIEENALGIFDVLRHSNLWKELRTMDFKPSKVLSSSTSNLNIPGEKFRTYNSLSDEIKHAMQDVVLQIIGFGCITGDEVIVKAQWFPFETSIKGAAGVRGYCNEDIIIHTLLDLVRDGLVEMATVTDPWRPMSKWVPRYRRVNTRRANDAVETIKASRCMKIAKPWKQRHVESSNTTELATGQKEN